MLRVSLQSSRLLSHGSIASRAGRQWLAISIVRAHPIAARNFADTQNAGSKNPNPVVLPGSASPSTNQPLPPGKVAASPLSATLATSSSSSNVPPANVPLTPPPPPSSTIQTAPPTTLGSPPPSRTSSTPPQPPSSTPPAPLPKPRRRFRRALVALLILSLAGYGGGIYYSRINDNFHDFFTEYVPFGEEAVLYFEERDFRKRFPTIANRSRSRDTGSQVTIPSQSGVSWKVSKVEKPPANKQTNAPQGISQESSAALQQPDEAHPKAQVAAVEHVKEIGDKSIAKPAKTNVQGSEIAKETKPTIAPGITNSTGAAPASDTNTHRKTSKVPEVDEPSRFPSEVTRIDPINIKDANEPLVQDLVKIINDIITVVNADNSNNKFTATIGKAKSELSEVGGKIKALKDAAAKEADEKVKASHEDFDRAAKELIRRLEGEMHEQESRWKEDYEQERQKLQQAYDQKLSAEIIRAKEVNEQRLHNELLEQAVEMKRKFVTDIKDRVEQERNGRLGKLSDLSNTVNELEKLTTEWNSVVETNLKTQRLHVAVEAVRANLEHAQTPRPFIRELVALKEIADDDPVVNAAIASINPTAYQRGIPTSAQLIDRFRRVAGEVRKASLLPEEAGVASHASSYLLSKLLFKKKGLVTGDDVESILTRTETYLEEGNLDEAAREMNGLTGWAKTLSKDWLGEVRKVLEVQQALDVIATEARLQSLRVE